MLTSTMAALLWLASPQRTFHLEPGEFHWIPVSVQRNPVEIDSKFRVVDGGPTVHMELLPLPEFRHFIRGKEHEAVAETPDGSAGVLQCVLDEPAEYRLVISNEPGAGPAMVVMELDQHPPHPRTLSPQRRAVVIAVSFAIFFAMVTFSAWRLGGAVKSSR